MMRILVLLLMCAWALPLAADEGKEAALIRLVRVVLLPATT